VLGVDNRPAVASFSQHSNYDHNLIDLAERADTDWLRRAPERAAIEGLIHCAAYFPVANCLDVDEVRRAFEVNVFSGIRIASCLLKNTNDRRFVACFILSPLGYWTVSGRSVYSATKAALERFAEGSQIEAVDGHSPGVAIVGLRSGFFQSDLLSRSGPTWGTRLQGIISRPASVVANRVVNSVLREPRTSRLVNITWDARLGTFFAPIIRHGQIVKSSVRRVEWRS